MYYAAAVMIHAAMNPQVPPEQNYELRPAGTPGAGASGRTDGAGIEEICKSKRGAGISL